MADDVINAEVVESKLPVHIPQPRQRRTKTKRARTGKTGRPNSAEVGPTMLQLQILRTYADPNVRSVAEVARIIDCSRTTVHETLNKPFANSFKLERERREEGLRKSTITDLRSTSKLISDKINLLMDKKGHLSNDEIAIVAGFQKLLLERAKTLQELGIEGAETAISESDKDYALQTLERLWAIAIEYKDNAIARDAILAYFGKTGDIPRDPAETVAVVKAAEQPESNDEAISTGE